MRAWLIALALAGSALQAFAQLDNFTITVSATRTIYAQPDQIVVGISVNTDLSASADQVVALLQPAGISASNLIGIVGVTGGPTSNDPPKSLEWDFNIAVPLAAFKAELDLLAGVQKGLARQTQGATITYGPQGAQMSSEKVTAQSCRPQDLMGDARAQASGLAAAAGYAVGPVVAVSDGTASPNLHGLFSTAVYEGASPPSEFPGITMGFTSRQPTLPVVCTMVVVFRLAPQ